MPSPPPTDASSNNSTNSTGEVVDRSDEFVDNRNDVCDPPANPGEQASLASEVIEGQTDLTGSQATEDPEYLDGGTRESALDALANGSWTPSTITRAFEVTGNVANSIKEMGSGASHVLKVEDNTEDLSEWPGIGDASAKSIRTTIPKLKARGITRHGLPIKVNAQAIEDAGGDVDELEGVESVTEQTVMEGIVDSLDVPEHWTIVDEHEDAEQEPSILVEHPDGYLAEMWLRDDDVSSGAGEWDIEYFDPVGTRRDGSGQFHESAQDALDELVPHIKEVRAEERDRAEQQAEQEDIDWPETIGRFRLREQTVSDTHAEYRTDYLAGYGILGTKRRERSEGIRFYDDTRKYHFMDETYARKKTAIETAEEKLTDLTETLDEREDAVIEQNDIPDHVLPHRYRGDLDDQDSGSDDVPDSKTRQMGVSPDDTDQLTVDIRFATEGISASVYAISETPNRTDLLEEAWYTWTEVDELTTDTESHIIFEIPVQHSQNENEDAAD